jgi:hypothetical protein
VVVKIVERHALERVVIEFGTIMRSIIDHCTVLGVGDEVGVVVSV